MEFLKIRYRNAALPNNVRLAVEHDIEENLVQLSGGIDSLIRYYNEPDRLRNPLSHFNRYFNQAVYSAMEEHHISPTLRREAKFDVVPY